MTTMSAANVQETGWQSAIRKIHFTRVVLWIFVALLIFVTFFPFYWVVRTGLNQPESGLYQHRVAAAH